MKFSTLIRVFIAAVFLLAAYNIAAAQNSGFGSYTSIDYDETTNTVMAYSQTDADYELQGDYETIVFLSVINDSGVVVASGSIHDYYSGTASIELDFVGEPNTTYTAIGTHHAYLSISDYAITYPYQTYYYDNYYFTSFENRNIYSPWSYYFTSPGYRTYTRRTQSINLGRTFDSTSAQTYSFRGSIQAQGPDISYRKDIKENLGDGVFGNGNTVSKKWAQNFPLTADDGIKYANTVKSKMTAPQLSNRVGAFDAAIKYINSCRRYGCPPSGSKDFDGINGAHVDVVINAGTNLVDSTTASPQADQ